ncbi:MAG: hypothetical protein O9295_16565 [Microcystis sp. LE18-22.4A]|nr:hypothetical protein [Microcystis sp. LE18-22.4A]
MKIISLQSSGDYFYLFFLLPTPYTPHPTPYTLHPTPHTLHPTPQFTPRCDSQILLKVSEIVAILVLPSQIILNIPPRRLTFE